MTFDDLSDAWRATSRPLPTEEIVRDVALVRQRSTDLDRAVRRRDAIEIGVALILLPVFVWLAATVAPLLSRIGAAFVALGCVIVPVRLLMARRRRPDPGQPVTTVLHAELRALRAQTRLLGTVTWWYFAPLGTGVILFVAGAPVSPWIRAAYALVVVLVYSAMIRLNHEAAARDVMPVIRHLERSIAALERNDSSGSIGRT